MDESSMKERLAVLESEMRQTKSDVDKIFLLIRKQMDREGKFQKHYMAKLNELVIKIERQRSFVGGIIFAVSGMWAIVVITVGWFFTKGH